MLTPVSISGVADDLESLLWAMQMLGGEGLHDAGPLTAEDKFNFAWNEYCTARRRLCVRLNEGDIGSLDCGPIDRMKLQTLWEWLQMCNFAKPTFRESGPQDFELIAGPFSVGEMGRLQLADLQPKGSQPKIRLNEPQQAIIRVIKDAGRRITTGEIMAKLGEVSESRTKDTLAVFVQFGLLTNTRGPGGGYGLPEWDHQSTDQSMGQSMD